MTRAVSIAQGGSNNVTMRNRIINGAMMIDQRNAGASLGSGLSTFWPVDRFQFNASVASKFTAQQTPSATETGYVTRVAAGFSSYLAFTSASAYSIGSGDYFFFRQRIEGTNTSDLAFGTSAAKTVTLSFWVNASLTGTYSVMITNNGQARTYIANYTVNSANTWEQKTITVAGDQSGTWLTSNGVGIDVNFCLGVGSTYATSTLNTWSSNFYLGSTSQVNVAGTSGATFYITGVQLEAGTTATPFEQRLYGTELALCQRYYEKSYNLDVVPATGSSAPGLVDVTTTSNNGGNAYVSITFKVTKRVAPSMTGYQYSGGTSGVWSYDRSGTPGNPAVNFGTLGMSGMGAYLAIGANNAVAEVYGHWTASAEL